MDKKNDVLKITIIGAIVNFILSIIKIITGYISNSGAMLADGLHSLSDLLSDSITFIAAKHSNELPDKEHPYGHKKFETLATLALSIILLLTGIWILFNALISFYYIQEVTHYTWLIIIAIISILSKESLFWATIFISHKHNSQLLKANAWHHRTDSLSSIAVLIGVIFSYYGFSYGDSIAAIIVAFMIIYISYDIGKPAIYELVDSTIELETLDDLKEEIKKIEGVVDLHMLRARSNAGSIIMDVHIQVPPKLSVSEGHMISISVEKVARIHGNGIEDITVHIDPENDDIVKPNTSLPDREKALEQIKSIIAQTEYNNKIKKIVLHYLNGKIDIDFYLSLKSLDNSSKMEILDRLQDIFKKCDNCENFNEVSLFFT